MERKPKPTTDEMRAGYNFDYSKGVRGKHYKRIQEEGTNVVFLERDVQKAFPDSSAVNAALRSLLRARRGRRGASGRNGRKRAGQAAR